MTPENYRTIVLGHIQKLEFNGQQALAHVLRWLLLEAEKVPELEETIAVLRTPPVGTGGVE